MSLMGTLARVAIGYAAARGVDALSGGRGLAGLFGGARVAQDEAETDHAPGIGNMQEIMEQMATATGAGVWTEMLGGVMGRSGIDLSALFGGLTGASGGGLMSSAGAGSGFGAAFASMGGMAAMGAQGAGAMLDQAARAAPVFEQDAGLLLRAMIQAAACDGGIDAAEREKILETLGAEAEAEDLAFVEAQMAAPADPEALAAETPAHLAMQVYAMSLMPIRLDSEAEAAYLDRLAAALGLNQETVNALHLQMGVKPLFG